MSCWCLPFSLYVVGELCLASFAQVNLFMSDFSAFLGSGAHSLSVFAAAGPETVEYQYFGVSTEHLTCRNRTLSKSLALCRSVSQSVSRCILKQQSRKPFVVVCLVRRRCEVLCSGRHRERDRDADLRVRSSVKKRWWWK